MTDNQSTIFFLFEEISLMNQPPVKRLSDYTPPDFTISKIDLTFELDDEATLVTAVSHVKRCADVSVLVLEGEDLTLKWVDIDGEDFFHRTMESEGKLSIPTKKDEFILTIKTEINPKANTKLEGLYLSDGAFCTQCEAEGFRRITYYLDRPDVLAKFSVRIEADKYRFPHLLSNGNPVDRGELKNNKHFVCWEDPFPKPSYLFALVAGSFDLLEDSFTTKSGREIDLQIFVDKGNLSKAHHAMASLKKSMKWDEDRFGLEYDLNIYMIVAVDFFNMGAMENKGLNVFNSKFVLADEACATDDDFHHIESVIGHEYFHNWTGNRVTCRDWFQLSLKEGLTVFRDQEFSSDIGSRTVNRIAAVKTIRNHQFPEDAGPMAHPIRPESVIEMNNFYTVTVYDKGSEVIRMMHTLLGEQAFQKGMKLYFERYDGKAVTCDDFVQSMQDASNVDLTQFKRWYEQAGTPELKVEQAYDGSKEQYSLTIHQHIPETHDGSPKKPLHMPIDVELLDAKGNVIPLVSGDKTVSSILHLKESKQKFTFDKVPEKPVVSLLREFSAPVKLTFDYSKENLAHLMSYATNEFARWDASQTLASNEIMSLIHAKKNHKNYSISPVFLDAMKSILMSTTLDKALIAEIFNLPSEAALAEMMDVVETELIYMARRAMMQALSVYLEKELLTIYSACLESTGQLSDDVKQRALKNMCLMYLAMQEKYAVSLVVQQYEKASNMTDQLAALQAVNRQTYKVRDTLMAQFEKQWMDTPLVMDKWFALQATATSTDTLNYIRALLTHKAFSMKNPNRVRALIGSFAMNNAYLFHHENASGYEFLGQELKVLNEINPQVAARIITPLTQWKRMPERKQTAMKKVLKDLKNLPNLSKDLYEKVSKSLEQ